MRQIHRARHEHFPLGLLVRRPGVIEARYPGLETTFAIDRGGSSRSPEPLNG